MTMNSNIDTSGINDSYPEAGKDNDTQGFRNNFASIKNALNQAKSEITELQNYAVLTAAVDTSTHTPVINNLLGSSIVNGTYNKFYGAAYYPTDINSSGAIMIDLSNGILQRFILSVDTSLTFTNWPSQHQYAKVRVHLTLNPFSTENTVDITSIASHGNGVKFKEPDFPTLHVSKTSELVFDAWSFNNGNTFYLKYIGEFHAGA